MYYTRLLTNQFFFFKFCQKLVRTPEWKINRFNRGNCIWLSFFENIWKRSISAISPKSPWKWDNCFCIRLTTWLDPDTLTCSCCRRIRSRYGRLLLQSFPLHFFHFLLHVGFFLQLFTFFLPLLTFTVLFLHLFHLQLSNRLLLTLKTFKFTRLWKKNSVNNGRILIRL